MFAGLPQEYKDTKVEDVQSLIVFPTEGESTRTEYRLCGSFVFIDYNGRQLGEPWMCTYFAKLLLPVGAVNLAGF